MLNIITWLQISSEISIKLRDQTQAVQLLRDIVLVTLNNSNLTSERSIKTVPDCGSKNIRVAFDNSFYYQVNDRLMK